jgi:hypothetical protein
MLDEFSYNRGDSYALHRRPSHPRGDVNGDGPDHDQPDVKAKDVQITDCLMDAGYTVLRFGYRRETWEGICAQHGYVFGVS